MADGEIPPEQAVAKWRDVSLAQRREFRRHRALDRRLKGWRNLKELIAENPPDLSRYGSTSTLSTFSSADVALVKKLVLESETLEALSHITKEENLRYFFQSLAHSLRDLLRNPPPSFINDAHKITAAIEKKDKKKSGRRTGMNSAQIGPLQVIDAIAILVFKKFISDESLTEKIYVELGLTNRQFQHYRNTIQPNQKTEELRFLLDQYDGKERVEEARRLLDLAVKEFREERRPSKDAGIPKSPDFPVY